MSWRAVPPDQAPAAELPPFRFFGGKGGAGKTTCAAAWAVAAAESGRRILIVSTDPAHSLGDALKVPLRAEPTEVRTRRGTLLAVELAAESALARWMGDHRAALRAIAERGTYLDGDDIEQLLGLSLPGSDELVGLLELARLGRGTGCAEVVVDTAPTAHTLRLLAMPEALQRYASALDRLQSRHRQLSESFGGRYRSDASDALIADLEAEGRALGERLRDPSHTSVIWVTLPEELAIAETRDAVAALEEAGIPVPEIVVNRVTPPGLEGCLLCRERIRAERQAIREIEAAFAGRDLRFLPAEEREPRGLPALRRLVKTADPNLHAGAGLAPAPASKRKNRPLRFPQRPPAWTEDLAPDGVRLLLFGGKGGVGKSTCAAAAALTLAAHRPEARVLLLSTDPAHSLGDVLEIPLGDAESPVAGELPGLAARELDAPRAFEAWREKHRAAVAGALGELTSGAGDAIAGSLLDAPPPGLDELIAVATLLDAVLGAEGAPPAFDLVVVDTAPTGHALRLLEMPGVALAWDHALLSLLLKYREALGLGDLAAELVALSRSLKRLQAMLADVRHTRFVAVTRAAELPRRETVRLLESLGRLAVAVPAVLVNAVTLPNPGCERCTAARSREEREIRALGASGRIEPCDIMTAPAVFPPPRGAGALAEWARAWKKALG